MGKRKLVKIVNSVDDPYITIGQNSTSNEFWRFGLDNLFPSAVAALNRRATVHRGILQSKTRYIAGKGITCDQKERGLVDWITRCNAHGETLQAVLKKAITDAQALGNAYLEIVTDARRSFMNLYHQDATKCRLSKDKKSIFLHHDWSKATGKVGRKQVAIFPEFDDQQNTGYLHSIIHIKHYEPEFENYGIMGWVAGLSVSAIAYKTDKWNISRLDNSFNSSGVLVVSGEFETPQDYEDFKDEFETEFIGEGKQGKILLMTQQPGATADAGTRYIPLSTNAEGDWRELHIQSTDDLVIAHGWFRSLSGIADNTGFDTKRILNEYEVALNTVIIDEQETMLSNVRKALSAVLRVDGSTLAFINRPPATEKPAYMKVWEARKADGLDYDDKDPAQNIYLANITQAKQITIQ